MIKATLVNHMGSDLTPVNAARISFNKEASELKDSDKKLIKFLADHKHHTPFEHQMMTLIIECPLYIRSQIHRHRTFSYNEVSRRYTSEEISFYVPETSDIRRQSKNNKQCSEGIINEKEADQIIDLIEHSHRGSFSTYHELLSRGVSREQARGVLPQNLMTKFYMTGNLRNWTHFIHLRNSDTAQKEVRDLTVQIQDIIKNLWPVTYEALFSAFKN